MLDINTKKYIKDIEYILGKKNIVADGYCNGPKW